MRRRLVGEPKERHNLRKREATWIRSKSDKVGSEMNDKVNTLGMFEFGSWHEATSKAGKAPTTTKWIDRVEKDDDGREFVRCRLVARGFKPTREGPRDDLFAAMPPLEAKKALFAYVPGVREKRRKQGQDEVKLMFIDVKKEDFNAKYDEE